MNRPRSLHNPAQTAINRLRPQGNMWSIGELARSPKTAICLGEGPIMLTGSQILAAPVQQRHL